RTYELEIETSRRLGKETREYDDVHGLELAIVEGEQASDVDQILGFHGAVLLSGNSEGTKELLTGQMGLKPIDIKERNHHFDTTGAEKHHIITAIPPQPAGRFGIGTVHHIAW